MVVAPNAPPASEALAAGGVLARGLPARLMRSGRGELILTVDEKAGSRARQEITGLAAALDIDAATTGVRVSVRIGSGDALPELSSEDFVESAAT